MRPLLLSASALALAALTPAAAHADCFEKLDAARDQLDQLEEPPVAFTQRFSVDYDTAAALAEDQPEVCDLIAERLQAMVDIIEIPFPSTSGGAQSRRTFEAVVEARMELAAVVTEESIESGDGPDLPVQREETETMRRARELAQEQLDNMFLNRVARLFREARANSGGAYRVAGTPSRSSVSTIQDAKQKYEKAITKLESDAKLAEQGKTPAEDQEGVRVGRLSYEDFLSEEYRRASDRFDADNRIEDKYNPSCDPESPQSQAKVMEDPGHAGAILGKIIERCAAEERAKGEAYERKLKAFQDAWRPETDRARKEYEEYNAAFNGQVKPGMEAEAARLMAEYEAKRKKRGAVVIDVKQPAKKPTQTADKTPASKTPAAREKQAADLWKILNSKHRTAAEINRLVNIVPVEGQDALRQEALAQRERINNEYFKAQKDYTDNQKQGGADIDKAAAALREKLRLAEVEMLQAQAGINLSYDDDPADVKKKINDRANKAASDVFKARSDYEAYMKDKYEMPGSLVDYVPLDQSQQDFKKKVEAYVAKNPYKLRNPPSPPQS